MLTNYLPIRQYVNLFSSLYNVRLYESDCNQVYYMYKHKKGDQLK